MCAAVFAIDGAGNHNVSRPLRVCYDQGGGKCAAYQGHASNFGALPDCGMSACTPGVRLNFKDMNGKWHRDDPFPSLTQRAN
jgi:hypothetical protein